MDLAEFESVVEGRRNDWAQVGFAHEFRQPSDEERTRDKYVAMLILTSTEAEGELLIWTSGEAELGVCYRTDGAIRQQHYDLMGTANLEGALDDLADLMVHRPPDDLLYFRPPRSAP